MGERAAETVKEIEEVRDRLGDQIDELQSRLPAPAVMAKRAVGVAVGGGVAGGALWWLIRRRRSRSKVEQAAEQAKERAAALVQVIPEGWAKAVRDRWDDERVRRWAGLAAGAWIVFRVAEARQLRRMNRALLAGR